MPNLQRYEEQPQVGQGIDCVEIYLPKVLEHLSPLYALLKETLEQRVGDIVLNGFSVYEVDGAFYGRRKIWEERTLVIRILFVTNVAAPESVFSRIKDLGQAIARRVAPQQEEIWICHYPQRAFIFRPLPAQLQIEG